MKMESMAVQYVYGLDMSEKRVHKNPFCGHVDNFDTFPGYVEIWAENRRFCQMSRTDSFPIRDMGLSGVGCDHGASSFRIILPLSVRRYFWSRLVGLSGMVISISLRRSANSELGS